MKQYRYKDKFKHLLHTNKLEEFKQFCLSQGWVEERTKGNYEVLRMRHPQVQHPLLVHTRLDPQGHYTTWGESQRMLLEWQSHQKATSNKF